MKRIILITFIFMSCNLFEDTVFVNLLIPEIPLQWENYENQISYKVIINDGKLRSFITKKTDISIELNKKMNSVICIYPVIIFEDEEVLFKPSGAIFPNNYLDNNLIASYENGFLAEVLMTLVNNDFPIEQFNIPRLEASIQEVSEGDPWSLNKALLLNKITNKEMSVYAVKKLELYFLEVNIPSGIWISENPFNENLISDGDLLELKIPSGLHSYYLDKSKMSIYIDEIKWIIISPEGSGSGYW